MVAVIAYAVTLFSGVLLLIAGDGDGDGCLGVALVVVASCIGIGIVWS